LEAWIYAGESWALALSDSPEKTGEGKKGGGHVPRSYDFSVFLEGRGKGGKEKFGMCS